MTSTEDYTYEANVAWMEREYLDEVCDIERRTKREHAWTYQEFLKLNRSRYGVGIICEIEGMTVGFLCYLMHPKELEIVNFAVHPEWQGLGVGSFLLRKLKRKLRHQRRSLLTAVVHERYTDMHMFLAMHDFVALGIENDSFLFQYEI